MKAILPLVMVMVVACGTVPRGGSDDDETTPTTADGGEEEPLVELAIGDLADTLGVDRDQVAVLSVDPVTWPDSSLGCPEPGVDYVDGDIDGFRIVLRHLNSEYNYHQGGEGDPFHCPPPPKRPIGPEPTISVPPPRYGPGDQ